MYLGKISCNYWAGKGSLSLWDYFLLINVSTVKRIKHVTFIYAIFVMFILQDVMSG